VKTIRPAAAMLAALALGGCGTFAQKTANGFGYPFDTMTEYPHAIECFKDTGPLLLFVVPYMMIDFPFSLVGDILSLPIDLAYRKSEPKKPGPCK
jgi:uncharacterized protein YceK